MKDDIEENEIGLGAKIAFAIKFNILIVVTVLSVLGAGVVQDNLHWGKAMAEPVKVVQSDEIVMPKQIDKAELPTPPYGGY